MIAKSFGLWEFEHSPSQMRAWNKKNIRKELINDEQEIRGEFEQPLNTNIVWTLPIRGQNFKLEHF